MSSRNTLVLLAVGLATATLWFATGTMKVLPEYARFEEGWSGDFRSYYLPNAEYAGERMSRGELPLWNPHQALGSPLLATTQVGALYPPNWLHALLPADRAFVVLALLHLVFAVFTAGRLAHALGADTFGSVVAGLVYASSPNLISSIYSPPLLYAAAWAPLLVMAVDRNVDAPSLRGIALLALVVCMMLLVGWPYAFAMTALAAALYGAVRLVALAIRERRLPWRAVVAGALGVALGCMLAAPQLLPTSELLARSCRAIGSVVEGQAVFVNRPHDPVLFWRSLLRFGFNDGAPGFVALALAALAVVLPGRGRARSALLLALGALALLVSFAGHTPLYGWLRELPVLGDFRFPFRYRFLTTLVLAVTAGVGTAHLRAACTRWPRMPQAVGLVAVAVCALTLTWQVFSTFRPFPRSVPELPTLAESLRANGVRAALTPTERVYWAEIADKRGADTSLDVVYDMEPMSLARTAELVTFFELGRPRTLQTLPEELAGEKPRGDSLTAPYYGKLGLPPTAERAALLDLMAVRWIATPAPPEWLDERYQRVSADGAELAVFHNPHALPRAYRVPGAFRAPAELPAALRTLIGERFDPRSQVLLERPPGRLVQAAAAGRTDPDAMVEIEAYDEESVRLRTRGARAGVVVLTDAFYPGWKATLDGAPAALLRANLAFRGVVVPRGEHVIEMVYRPASFRRGLALAGLAVAGLGIALWRARAAPPAQAMRDVRSPQ